MRIACNMTALAVLAGMLAGGLLAPARSLAQDAGFLECSSCQIILDLSATSAPPGAKDVQVDMAKPCSILQPGDQKACAQFFAGYGPKFIKAIQERRAKGESYHQMCGRMGYCQ